MRTLNLYSEYDSSKFDICTDTSVSNLYSGLLMKFFKRHGMKMHTEEYKTSIQKDNSDPFKNADFTRRKMSEYKFNVDIPEDSIGMFLGAEDWYRIVVDKNNNLMSTTVMIFTKFLVNGNIVSWKITPTADYKNDVLLYTFKGGLTSNFAEVHNKINLKQPLESVQVTTTEQYSSDSEQLTKINVLNNLFMSSKPSKHKPHDIANFLHAMNYYGFRIELVE